MVVGLDAGAASAGPTSAAELQLSFRRVPGGALPDGVAALEAAVAEETARAQAMSQQLKDQQSASQQAQAQPNGAAGKAAPKGLGLGGAAALPGMGARAAKFDPLRAISAAAKGGEDLSADGSAARADPDSLPPNCN